ncbi:MAG TPA: hypothetical protein VGV89_10455 [Thermoplasmata archaeon]|nr:hypothetical protein [Thermoplasmata archaeon]
MPEPGPAPLSIVIRATDGALIELTSDPSTLRSFISLLERGLAVRISTLSDPHAREEISKFMVESIEQHLRKNGVRIYDPGAPDGPVLCPECGRPCANKKGLSLHMSRRHQIRRGGRSLVATRVLADPSGKRGT